MSGNPTTSSDSEIESTSPSPIPYEDSDSLVEETDTLLSHFNDSSPDYETFCFDIEEKASVEDLSLKEKNDLRVQETQEGHCVSCESANKSKSWPSIFLEACSNHQDRRYGLWELWDCQLGNLTAGKVYGGGGKGLSMGEIGESGLKNGGG
ncbi:hypothetical protein Tco_0450501 [Tanacetum coccineum]